MSGSWKWTKNEKKKQKQFVPLYESSCLLVSCTSRYFATKLGSSFLISDFSTLFLLLKCNSVASMRSGQVELTSLLWKWNIFFFFSSFSFWVDDLILLEITSLKYYRSQFISGSSSSWVGFHWATGTKIRSETHLRSQILCFISTLRLQWKTAGNNIFSCSRIIIVRYHRANINSKCFCYFFPQCISFNLYILQWRRLNNRVFLSIFFSFFF